MNPHGDLPMDGILILDKPVEMTSAGLVSRVKRITRIKKAGHCGILDPFATGVMIVCLNRATRISRFFLAGQKTYRGVLKLGITTDTQDKTGREIGRADVSGVSESQIREVFQRFVGDQTQAPPVYSALKQNGVPLYRLARQGSPVQKPPRPITIHRLTVEGVEEAEVRFTVACSAGTYVRTLAADIGAALGCGGHLSELRRVASGGFTEAEAGTPEALQKAVTAGRLAETVIPMAEALRGIPGEAAGFDLKEKIRHGRPVTTADVKTRAVSSGYVKILDENGRLLAVLAAGESRRLNYVCAFGT